MPKVDVISTHKDFAKVGTRKSIPIEAAKVLVKIGRAEYATVAADVSAAPARRGYKRRDMAAEPVVPMIETPVVETTKDDDGEASA